MEKTKGGRDSQRTHECGNQERPNGTEVGVKSRGTHKTNLSRGGTRKKEKSEIHGKKTAAIVCGR